MLDPFLHGGGTMTHFSKAAIALVVVVVGTSQARANFVPWAYNWEPTPLIIHADGRTHGHLMLTDEPIKLANGTSDVAVTNIRAFSTAPRGRPDHFAHAVVIFTLVLTDLQSGQTARLRFGGFFTGTISNSSADVRFHEGQPRMDSVELGNHIYTVTLGRYSPPGPPGVLNAGMISAHVEVDNVPPLKSPAPSSLVLSCLGLAGLGLFGWRRWYSSGTRS
jgi:hypothetical protein